MLDKPFTDVGEVGIGIPVAINDRGDVLGISTMNMTPGVYSAADGKVYVLPPDPGGSGKHWTAQAINNRGQVSGYMRAASPNGYVHHTEPVRYTPDYRDDGTPDYSGGTVEPLGLLATFVDGQSRAPDIPDDGYVVGTVPGRRRWSSPKAFLYTDTDGMLNLGVLLGKETSVGFCINNLGEVVGYGGLLYLNTYESGTMATIKLTNNPVASYPVVADINEWSVMCGLHKEQDTGPVQPVLLFPVNP